jgi:hypothetical protein
VVRDLLLDDTGDLAIVGADLGLVGGIDAIRQHARMRLQFFLGEWFLDDPDDPKIGTPLFQKVLIKNPDRSVLLNVFRQRLLGTPGIKDVTSLSLDYEGTTRKLRVAWMATSDLGAVGDTMEIRA